MHAIPRWVHVIYGGGRNDKAALKIPSWHAQKFFFCTTKRIAAHSEQPSFIIFPKELHQSLLDLFYIIVEIHWFFWKMGGQFGNLIKYKNVISYSLSPFEQRAFAGFFSKGVGNLYRRFMGQVFYVLPPFVMGAMIINAAEKENLRLSRKNPEDFAHES